MVRKPRVLMVSMTYPSKGFSAGTFVEDSVRALVRSGRIGVEVVSPKARVLPFRWFPYHDFASLPLQEVRAGVRIHYPRYLYPALPPLVRKEWVYHHAGKLFARSMNPYVLRNVRRPDIIHAHFSYPDGFAAALLARQWGIPLVIHARGTLEKVIGVSWKRTAPLIRWVFECADVVVANNPQMRSFLVRQYGIPSEKVVVVENGIDDRFVPMDMRRAQQRLGLPQDARYLLFVGNLVDVKDVGVIIDAMAYLFHLKECANVHLLVIGDGPLRGALARRAARLGIGSRVHFLGQRPREEIPYYLSSSHALVLASKSEGRPNVVVEAMACARPVIATRVGDVPNLVAHGRSGFLFDIGDAGALAKHALALVRDAACANRMGIEGRRKVLSMRLSWDEHARKLAQLYVSLVQKNHKKRKNG